MLLSIPLQRHAGSIGARGPAEDEGEPSGAAGGNFGTGGAGQAASVRH